MRVNLIIIGLLKINQLALQPHITHACNEEKNIKKIKDLPVFLFLEVLYNVVGTIQ